MSCIPEPTMQSCDTGQRIPFFDSCQLITTWMSNTKIYTDSIKVCHLASANMKGVDVRMSVLHMDNFLRTKISCKHRLPYFLTRGALLHDSAKIHVKCKHDVQDCIIIQVYITIQPTTWVGPYKYALSEALCDL